MDPYSVILDEPITRKYGEISGRWWERNRNHWTAEDLDSTKATSSLVESKGRKVKETTNLVFKLKNISKILAWWDGAVCAIHTILPRIPSLLYSIPALKLIRKIISEKHIGI